MFPWSLLQEEAPVRMLPLLIVETKEEPDDPEDDDEPDEDPLVMVVVVVVTVDPKVDPEDPGKLKVVGNAANPVFEPDERDPELAPDDEPLEENPPLEKEAPDERTGVVLINL